MLLCQNIKLNILPLRINLKFQTNEVFFYEKGNFQQRYPNQEQEVVLYFLEYVLNIVIYCITTTQLFYPQAVNIYKFFKFVNKI